MKRKVKESYWDFLRGRFSISLPSGFEILDNLI
jgi:hypothetical protein